MALEKQRTFLTEAVALLLGAGIAFLGSLVQVHIQHRNEEEARFFSIRLDLYSRYLALSESVLRESRPYSQAEVSALDKRMREISSTIGLVSSRPVTQASFELWSKTWTAAENKKPGTTSLADTELSIARDKFMLAVREELRVDSGDE